MRVRELAKELAEQYKRNIDSKEILVYLNKKNDSLVAASNVSEDLISYVRNIYKNSNGKPNVSDPVE